MTDTSSTVAGIYNPFRYRGYIYDTETGLYYLQSRYYDPELGRFVNADGQISGVGNDLLGNNQFAYCFNNPVNLDDNSGNWPKWATKLVAAVAVVAVVAVVAAVTVATAGAGTAIAAVAVGAAKGAAIGFAVGAATGAAGGAISHRISTGSWDGAGEAALNGMANGALSGAISGAITGGINGGVSHAPNTTSTNVYTQNIAPNNGYTPPLGGGGVTDTVQVGNMKVTFGHGGRHLSGTSFTTSQVNSTIAQDVVGRNLAVGQYLPNGSVSIGGTTVAYTAMRIGELLINVGTYHIIMP